MGSRRAERRQRHQIERRRRTLRSLVIVGGAAVFIAAVLIISAPRTPSTSGAIVVPTPFPRPQAEGTGMGDPNAPVRMEEFSDFQCPFCRRFSDETEPQLVEQYISTGQVYFVYRQYPILGPSSIRAAEASLCAVEQDMFWPYHDILFANQNERDPAAFSLSRLDSFAESLEMDVPAFQACMSDGRNRQAIEPDIAAAREAGIDSTPSFLINGKPVIGALPLAQFQAEIEAALAAASP